MFKRIPFDRVIWVTSVFLSVTLAISLTVTPWYVWHFGLNWFQIALFFVFYCATGLSITMGYHRLFAHLSFKAKTPIKLLVLIFGSASFENSAIDWVSDHRRHHKHVDEDEDPYDITKGFWYAHIGWMMFKLRPEPPQDNIPDLWKDKLVLWQHRWTHLIGVTFGFGLPTLLGAIYGWLHYGTSQAIATQALGGFLIAGVLRIVCVQHSTFCINSVCHWIGRRPYSTKCSARDSGLVALITFGVGIIAKKLSGSKMRFKYWADFSNVGRRIGRGHAADAGHQGEQAKKLAGWGRHCRGFASVSGFGRLVKLICRQGSARVQS